MTGILHEVRRMLEIGTNAYEDEQVTSMVAKLDAFIASVPEGLPKAIDKFGSYPRHEITMTGDLFKAAQLLHTATRKD